MLCFSWPLRNGKPRGRDNAVVYLNSRPDAPAATRGLVPVTVKITPEQEMHQHSPLRGFYVSFWLENIDLSGVLCYNIHKNYIGVCEIISDGKAAAGRHKSFRDWSEVAF